MHIPSFIAEAVKLFLMISYLMNHVSQRKKKPSILNFDEVKSGKISAQPNNSLCLQYWMKEGSGVTIPERLPL